MMYKTPTITALVLAMGAVIPSASAAEREQTASPRVSNAVRHDTSPAL